MMTWSDGTEGDGLALDTWGDHPVKVRRARHARPRPGRGRHAARGGCTGLVLAGVAVVLGLWIVAWLLVAASSGGWQP